MYPCHRRKLQLKNPDFHEMQHQSREMKHGDMEEIPKVFDDLCDYIKIK